MGIALILLVIGGIALHGALGAAAWVVGGAVAFLYWYRDVRRHPAVRCRACKGSGGHQSKIGGSKYLRRPFGDCWFCGGRKAFPRPGLRFVDRKRYDEIKGRIAKGRSDI